MASIDFSALEPQVTALETLITATNASMISDDDGSLGKLQKALTDVKDDLSKLIENLGTNNETLEDNSGSKVCNLW